MKQLFCIISVFVLLCNSYLFAKNSIKGDSTKLFDTKIDFADEDAYFIYNNTELEVINDNTDRKMDNYIAYSYAKKIVIHFSYRMKLNTSKGVENYAYLSINNNDQTLLNSFEVKTFKPNGTIIKFDSTQIFNSSIPDLVDKKENLELTKYVIPGAEIGDEIEVNYSIEMSGILTQKFYGNVFLNNFLPSLHSQYTIIIPYPYKIFLKCYNGFKPPEIEYNDLRAYNTFSIDSLPAVKDLSYSCLYDEFPYFYYSIEFDKNETQFLKWKDFYNEFVTLLNIPIDYNDPQNLKIEKWIKKNLKEYKSLSKYDKLEMLYNKIRNEFEITYPIQQSSNNNPLDDLYNNKINRTILYILYSKMFEYLEIDYYACFGRNKYYGSIDENFLRKAEITDYFFMYYNSDSISIFLFPHEPYKKYNIDETPSYLNRTEMFVIRNNNINDNKRDYRLTNVSNDSYLLINKLYVNKNDTADNYYNRLRTIGVDLLSNETQYSSIINFSGCTSTDNRHFYVDLLSNKEHYKLFLDEIQKGRDLFKVDSIYFRSESPKFPFNYSVGIKGKLGSFYNYINDSTIVISVDEILNSNKIEYDKQFRELDILLPNAFTDIQDLVIEFNKPIYVINLELLRKEFNNKIGNYKFESKVIGDNRLRLTSTYTIYTDLIEKKSFKSLNDLNDASDEMSNTRIIIGIKK